MINAPTVAAKRPVFKLVIEMNRETRQIETHERKKTICILFPGVGNPLIILFDFTQIHIPHLVLRVFLGCRQRVNVVMQL
jgi:hypothetical protein